MDAVRAFDLAGSAALLVVATPVMAASAAAIALESRGGVLFRQERMGRHGIPFHIRKFRTMRVDAPGALVTVAGDARITRVGSFLRATKLDELPQLLDVLQGRMSLVGPRPEVRRYADQWPEALRETILSVRPGITDPMSVQLRRESEELAAQDDPERYYVDVLLPKKAAAYAQYVRSRTLSGDLRILISTVAAVLAR